MLEVDVVNQWPNRLIGDSFLPKEQRRTRTNIKYTQTAQLYSSGLLGPVQLMRIRLSASSVIAAPPSEIGSTVSTRKLPLPGESFAVEGRSAFLIPAKIPQSDQSKPWVLYAPTFPNLPGAEEGWMFKQFQDAGIGVAGIDIGESFGSPHGRALFSAFYKEMTERRGYSIKPVLLGRSRGGLMTLAWAAENPEKIAAWVGIYPVSNIASYPGVSKAASAYNMTAEELVTHLTEHNPIDRLAPLAKARVPFFAVHGDSDKTVPLEANSKLLEQRYTSLGGSMQLIVVPGQGHNMWKGFFQNQALVDFVKSHAVH